MAYARSIESERPDAIVRDPLSRRLAGTAGEAIARGIGDAEVIASGIAVRTAVFDELILERVSQGNVDLVLNLAAGLDARPWRLALPRDLIWVDVDLPTILQYKADVIGSETPICQYETLHADITKAKERARVVAYGAKAHRIMVISEGLLVYLTSKQVAALARDLHKVSSILWWLTDLSSPRALAMLKQLMEPMLGGVKFQFAPADSVEFFRELGWREQQFRSMQAESRRVGRDPPGIWLTRVWLFFSTQSAREEFRRLSGIALLARDVVPAPKANQLKSGPRPSADAADL
jgi:methyltransferase (TIGR00027 family)